MWFMKIFLFIFGKWEIFKVKYVSEEKYVIININQIDIIVEKPVKFICWEWNFVLIIMNDRIILLTFYKI